MSLQSGAFYVPLVSRIKSLPKVLGITFWLQVAVLAAAATSVEAAGWVESPPLVLIAFLAVLTATLLVNLREHRKAHHLWALLAGGFLAYMGGIYLTEADQWYLRFSTLHSRLAQWWSAVIGEDATTDTLPLSVTIIAITWVAAYFASWGLFKHQNVWATLLPIGAGVVINLTYLPERFSIYLFVFLFLGLLMLVHVTNLRQRALLQAQSIPHPTSIHRLYLAHGLWLSIIILGVTVVIPIGDSPAEPLKWVFRPMERAVDDLQDELYRIFAAVPGHNLASLRFFGSVLPLSRTVPQGNTPVFFAESLYPLYWPAVAFDQYTSKAWKVGGTETWPVVNYNQGVQDEDTLGPRPGSVFYEVEMFVNAPFMMVSGAPLEVNPSAKQQLPVSPTYHVDLATPLKNNKDLPPDLQRWAESVTASAEDGESLSQGQIPTGLFVTRMTKELPDQGGRSVVDIKLDSNSYFRDLTQAFKSAGKIVGLEVSRGVVEDSVVSYKPVEPLRANSKYRVLTDLKLPSAEFLQRSLSYYPPEIEERYLQLPADLPSRVGALAQALTKDIDNPYSKAVAIESYLRTMEYTVAFQSIPHDADTVDYFLFESRNGYSDYFTSAMAIMLRTQGIPTRLLLGFGPGGEDPDKQGFLVLDKDSHSWPEVYFTNVGWVPFEPTPIYPTRSRGFPTSPFGPGSPFVDQAGQEELGAMGGLLDPLEEQEERNDLGGPLSGGEGMRALPLRYFGTPLGMGGALFALFLLMGAAVMRMLWVHQYGGLRSPQGVYERMHRLATFLGLPSTPSQTAFEFSRNLSQLIPEARTDIDLVSNTFVRQRYGGITPTSMDELRVVWAWRHIKRALMSRLRQTKEPAAVPG